MLKKWQVRALIALLLNLGIAGLIGFGPAPVNAGSVCAEVRLYLFNSQTTTVPYQCYGSISGGGVTVTVNQVSATVTSTMLVGAGATVSVPVP
jgi:hypothetical protein